MKPLIITLAIVTTLCTCGATEPVSVEEFMQIKDESKRLEVIEQAPPEQQADLRQKNHRIHTLQQQRGEERFKRTGKALSARRRGVAAPIALLAAQDQFWTFYISAVSEANRTMGLSPDQRSKAMRELESKQQTLRNREATVIEQVFCLAITPQALELNNRAQKLCDSILDRLSHVMTASLTIEERDQMDKDVDAILFELQKLPALAPEQIQKERDALSDEKP